MPLRTHLRCLPHGGCSVRRCRSDGGDDVRDVGGVLRALVPVLLTLAFLRCVRRVDVDVGSDLLHARGDARVRGDEHGCGLLLQVLRALRDDGVRGDALREVGRGGDDDDGDDEGVLLRDDGVLGVGVLPGFRVHLSTLLSASRCRHLLCCYHHCLPSFCQKSNTQTMLLNQEKLTK